MTMAAAPASAQLPIPIPEQPDVAGIAGGAGGAADTGNVQVLNGNSGAVSVLGDSRSEGGDTAARSGDAYGGDGGDARGSGGGAGRAEGGDGGRAETGNVQAGNGNSLAVSVGSKGHGRKHGRSHSKARSEGGDTFAKSGDAHGGRGGDARSGKHRGEGRRCDHRREKGGERTLGWPFAWGGEGGDASTGNRQFLNGNSLALALFGGAWSEGGDTLAKSGDAYGGDGGEAGLLQAAMR
ncbi:MAG: hypothetical protein JW895_17980 [Thermoleophilaceae bacterium]|nr:hypothetical protein [Thermoleophilaceae bacterium]